METLIKIIIIFTVLIIVFLLFYRKTIHKKILGFQYDKIENNFNKNLENEKFSADPTKFCPKLQESIIYEIFTPQKCSYLGMINNNQPFNDYDSCKMIVESKNFIFMLNESMTRISRASKIDLQFSDITQDLIDRLNLNLRTYSIPFIAACHETDECFLNLSIYSTDKGIISKTNQIMIIGDKTPVITKVNIDNQFVNIDLINKIIVEAKIVKGINYYNIYGLHKKVLDQDNNIFQSYIVNFFGNTEENDLNFYYGEKNVLKLNSNKVVKFEEQDISNITIQNKINYDYISIDVYYKELINYVLYDNYSELFNIYLEISKKSNNIYPNSFKTLFLGKIAHNEFINNTLDNDYKQVILNMNKINKSIDIKNVDLQLDTLKKNEIKSFGILLLKIVNKYRNFIINDGLVLGVNDFCIDEEKLTLMISDFQKFDNNKIILNFKIGNITLQDIKNKIKEKNLPISNYKEKSNYENYQVLNVSDSDKENYYIYKSENKYQLYNIHNKSYSVGCEPGIKCNSNNTLSVLDNNDYYKELLDYEYLFIDEMKDYSQKELKTYFSKIFKIKVGSINGVENIYGILKYNDNALVNNYNKFKNNSFHKRDVFFTVFANPEKRQDKKKGPIYIKSRFFIDYLFNPSIKFDYSTNTGFKNISLYNWFLEKQNEGKFRNRKSWFDIYDVMRSEGIYYPNPKAGFKVDGKDFKKTMKELADSLQEDPNIKKNGLFTRQLYEVLRTLKNIYDEKMDIIYPKLEIYKNLGLEDNKCFVSINFEPDNEIIQNQERKVSLIGLDNEPLVLNDKYQMSALRSQIFENKYMNKDDKFKYNHHILFDNTIKEVSILDDKSKFTWYKKQINNFNEYLNLISDQIQLNDNSRDRVRGLYDIPNKFMDNYYKDYILEKIRKNPLLAEELKVLVKEIDKNINGYKKETETETEPEYTMAHGYPFWVIYKVIDYNGQHCLEGSKSSQKIFLTNKILKIHIVNSKNKMNDYTDIKQLPFIKEEFLSFTGYGNDIHFYGQRIGGSTQISPKQFCNYPAFPIDDCSLNSCSKTKLCLVRLDGSPKCAIQDVSVQTNPETPNSVEIIGNASENACDLFKIKGNKKIYYRLGRVFKYGRDVKYQLKNIYTIQQIYDDKYFYVVGENIILKSTLDSSKIDNYSFEGESKTDKYGSYYVFKPKGKNKYLTRKINVFDNEFEDWKLEELKDITKTQRNTEVDTTNINDIDYYSQKFAIPDELIVNIASQDNINTPISNALLDRLRKQESINCKVSPELCEGDKSFQASMSAKEEREFLNNQLEDVKNIMDKLDKVPLSFYNKPDLSGLAKKIKQLKTKIPEIKTNIITAIKANDYLLKLEEDMNKERKQVLLKKQEKNNLFNNSNMNNSKNNQKQQEDNKYSVSEELLKQMKNSISQEYEPAKCKTIENFDNLEQHISNEYTDYISDKMKNTRDVVGDMQLKVNENLQKINQLSSNIKLDGKTKKILLSDKINQSHKLNRDIFQIKKMDQQSRIQNIVNKLQEIENIKKELNEDDFKTKNHNNPQYKTLISGYDQETINMYDIKDTELKNQDISNNNHMLFLNNGCLSYNNMDITTKHCLINDKSQSFQMYRIDDVEDMKKYNIKNHNKGIKKPYSIIMSNDKKCLHKENNNLSFRNCDNIDNQYWDYSNITGGNN